MNNKTPRRKPRAFAVDDVNLKPSSNSGPNSGERTEDGTAQPDAAAQDDDSGGIFEQGEHPKQDHTAQQQPATSTISLREGIRWGGLLFSTMLALLALAAGVWFARFTSIALAREDWVGWLAQGLLAMLIVSASVLIAKELFGFFRLVRLSRIRADADTAIASGDRKSEESAVRALKRLASGRSHMKWSLAAFRESERHMRKPGELLGLADRVLLAEPDKQARRIIFESARRVGIVTAVVPVAFLVMLFVLSENIRMVRRLAAAYGGRPGVFGGIRLLWRVVMHVAATGAIALTDDLFGQFLGQDILRRISRRLGEGAFIGALTARLGVAAIEVCRPLPYIEAAPLRSRHVVRELFPELKPSELARAAFRKKNTEPEKL